MQSSNICCCRVISSSFLSWSELQEVSENRLLILGFDYHADHCDVCDFYSYQDYNNHYQKLAQTKPS